MTMRFEMPITIPELHLTIEVDVAASGTPEAGEQMVKVTNVGAEGEDAWSQQAIEDQITCWLHEHQAYLHRQVKAYLQKHIPENPALPETHLDFDRNLLPPE